MNPKWRRPETYFALLAVVLGVLLASGALSTLPQWVPGVVAAALAGCQYLAGESTASKALATPPPIVVPRSKQ